MASASAVAPRRIFRAPSSPGAVLRPAIWFRCPLLHFYFDRFRFACWAFRQMHFEHAILELGRDLSRVGILRDCERAQECAIGALDPMEFLFLFFLLGLALA